MNRKTDKGKFTEGSVASNILRMSVPMLIAQIINVLYSIVDRMYIGRMPNVGLNALTGIGICAPAISVITAFANLSGMGGAPLFAQARGRGDDKEASRIMGNAFCMILIFSAIVMTAGYLLKRPILMLLGADSSIYEYASLYFSIYLAGTFFSLISLGMNPFVNAQGEGKVGMLTVAIGAFVNIALDPLLIFVLNLGVAGAALATIISQALSAAWVIRFLIKKDTSIRLEVKDIRLNAGITGRIAALGTSSFVMSFTTSIVQMLYNTHLLALGGTIYVSIMTIVNSVRELFFAAVNGFTNGATPVISYNYGAGKYTRVRKGIVFLTVAALAYAIVAWALFETMPVPFIRLFNSDPELLEKGVSCFRIFFATFMFMAFQLSGQTVSVALGKAKTAIFFSLLRKIIIVAPLIFIMPNVFNLGVKGIFFAEPISNVLGGFSCWLNMMITVYWRLKKKPDI